MDALLKSYLQGLGRLKEEVKVGGGDYESLDLLQMRLKENIDDKSRYGSTKENEARRAEILGSLNEHTRNLYGLSFDEYCQQNSQRSPLPGMAIVQDVTQGVAVTEEGNATRNIEQLVLLGDSSLIAEQAAMWLSNVNQYITTLRDNVQEAISIFSGQASIGQESCRDAFSLFSLFDYRNFPDYNESLFRAKVRLQHLNEQINKFISFCNVCEDVDRYAKLNAKKIQDLIVVLNFLYYEIGSVQDLLSKIDIDIS